MFLHLICTVYLSTLDLQSACLTPDLQSSYSTPDLQSAFSLYTQYTECMHELTPDLQKCMFYTWSTECIFSHLTFRVYVIIPEIIECMFLHLVYVVHIHYNWFTECIFTPDLQISCCYTWFTECMSYTWSTECIFLHLTYRVYVLTPEITE